MAVKAKAREEKKAEQVIIRLVAGRNVALKQEEGWEVLKHGEMDEAQKRLADRHSDCVLMKKAG